MEDSAGVSSTAGANARSRAMPVEWGDDSKSSSAQRSRCPALSARPPSGGTASPPPAIAPSTAAVEARTLSPMSAPPFPASPASWASCNASGVSLEELCLWLEKKGCESSSGSPGTLIAFASWINASKFNCTNSLPNIITLPELFWKFSTLQDSRLGGGLFAVSHLRSSLFPAGAASSARMQRYVSNAVACACRRMPTSSVQSASSAVAPEGSKTMW
mmetsp:Transcript_81297/g.235752  ORF Transcript_81297/g.235752 Transcript_81297/m.235752 type:complete len:217 (+) Transcript_81297:229-879(+)